MRGRVLAAAAVGAVVCTVSAGGQQGNPTFRGGVDLVTLDVSVIDRNGRPVPDLTAEDFIVELAGEKRPVRVVDYLELASADQSAFAPGRRQTTTGPPSAERAARNVVIAVDDLSFDTGQHKPLMAAAERWLETLGSQDMVGVATTSAAALAIAPTRDRGSVASVLGRIQARKQAGIDLGVAVTLQEAFEMRAGNIAVRDAVIDRECPENAPAGKRGMGDRVACELKVGSASVWKTAASQVREAEQIRAVERIIRSMAALPSPRLLVLLSDGLPLLEGPVVLEAIGKAAAEAGVRVFCLTPVADLVDMTSGGIERSPYWETMRRMDDQTAKQGLETLAGITGGESFRVVGSASADLQRITTETAGIYRLGVEAPSESKRQRIVTAKVSVRAPGVRVSASTRALVASAAPEVVSADDQLREAIRRGGAAFGVPITIATALGRDASGSVLQIGVSARVPRATAAPLHAAFALVDEMGHVVTSGQLQPRPDEGPGDPVISFAIPVAPGRYRLRFALVDGEAHLGAIEHPVYARLAKVGSYFVGDLMTAWAGADGTFQFLALEDLPDTAQVLRISMELYRGDVSAPDQDLKVRLALTREGQTTPATDIVLDTTEIRGGRRTGAQLSLAALAPGAYDVKATVLENGIETGEVTTIINKPAVPKARPSSADVLRVVRDEAIRQVSAFDVAAVLAPSVLSAHLAAVAAAAGQPQIVAAARAAATDDAFWSAVDDLARTPTGAVGAFASGVRALKAHDGPLAVHWFYQALQNAPAANSIILFVGIGYVLAGQDQDAAGALQMGLADPLASPPWYASLAAALARAGQPAEALDILRDGGGRWPADASLQRARTFSLLANEQFAEGRAALGALLRARSDDEPTMFIACALALADALKPDRPADAVEAFRALAERYQALGGPHSDLVAEWLQAMADHV